MRDLANTRHAIELKEFFDVFKRETRCEELSWEKLWELSQEARSWQRNYDGPDRWLGPDSSFAKDLKNLRWAKKLSPSDREKYFIFDEKDQEYVIIRDVEECEEAEKNYQRYVDNRPDLRKWKTILIWEAAWKIEEYLKSLGIKRRYFWTGGVLIHLGQIRFWDIARTGSRKAEEGEGTWEAWQEIKAARGRRFVDLDLEYGGTGYVLEEFIRNGIRRVKKKQSAGTG